MLIGAWWTVVIATGSVIFPTPWQVVNGVGELMRDGTLWQHIAASLFRVGSGFALAALIAIPLGLCFYLQAAGRLEASGIWLAIVAGHFTRCVLSAARFHQGKWQHIPIPNP